MNVHVNTNDFEFAHGKQPRGNGSWAFFFARRADVNTAFWFNGSYADAKKAAKEEAKRRGFDEVFVGS